MAQTNPDTHMHIHQTQIVTAMSCFTHVGSTKIMNDLGPHALHHEMPTRNALTS